MKSIMVIQKKSHTLILLQTIIFLRVFTLVVGSIEAFGQYSYNPEGKTDPFMPEETSLLNAFNSKDFKNFEATQVTLLGTILGTEPTALVQLPGDTNSVVLKIGSRIGTNSGSVISISKNDLVIREIFAGVGKSNKNGKTFRDTVVKFKYDSGKTKDSAPDEKQNLLVPLVKQSDLDSSRDLETR
jgi:hypothetical protein